MTRIGELLLENGWVDTTNLRRALSEQALTGGKRLCSLLIARGLLDPDHAARALSEQHEVPAVLQKHLEHRDRSLAQLFPASFAREHFALPIGRTRTGELIVCVRDPSPKVQAVIRRALTGMIVIAVAPASQLEQLIEESYEPENEFDVDLSTGAQIQAPTGGNLLDPVADDEPSMPEIGILSLVELDDVRVNKDVKTSQAEYKLPPRTTPPPFNAVTPPFGSITPPTQPPASRTNLPPRSTPPPFGAMSSPFASITPPFAIATPPPPGPPPKIELEPELEPEIVPELEPEEIDGLAEVMDRSPQRPSEVFKPSITTPAAPPTRQAPRVMIPPLGAPLPARPALRTPTTPTPHVRLAIAEVIDAIADAVSRDTATDVAMRFAGQRWAASLLLAVKEGAALGHRGHGPHLSADAVRAVAIPLTSPSIVKAALDSKKLVTESPTGAGAIQERIVRMLGQPIRAVAAPIVVAGRIACVFVVGDLNGSGDSASELDRLTTALGDAYTRILRDQK